MNLNIPMTDERVVEIVHNYMLKNLTVVNTTDISYVGIDRGGYEKTTTLKLYLGEDLITEITIEA